MGHHCGRLWRIGLAKIWRGSKRAQAIVKYPGWYVGKSKVRVVTIGVGIVGVISLVRKEIVRIVSEAPRHDWLTEGDGALMHVGRVNAVTLRMLCHDQRYIS